MKSGKNERRQWLRYPLAAQVQLRDGMGSVRGHNISAGGLGFVADHHLTPGTLMQLDTPQACTLQILHSMRRPDGRWQVGGAFQQPLGEELSQRFLPSPPIILVVEEDVDVREVIELSFQFNGLSAWPVASGTEALSVVSRHGDQLALVLIDVGLNGRDGVHTVAAIRQVAPALPCWLMTGGTDHDLEQKGADRVLVKPLDFGDLIDSVKKCLTR
ncbi:MAG: response regulator [Gemmataceae bacterium]